MSGVFEVWASAIVRCSTCPGEAKLMGMARVIDGRVVGDVRPFDPDTPPQCQACRKAEHARMRRVQRQQAKSSLLRDKFARGKVKR